MNEKKEIKNIGFFKKVWYSITKFEQYPTMAAEGLRRAIRYLIMLTAIVTIFAMIGSTLQMKTLVDDLASYIYEKIPEFSVTDGNITMDVETPIIIEDIQYEGIDKIFINPLLENEEERTQFEKDNLEIGKTVFFFKNEIVLETKIESGETVRQPYTYNEFIASYTGENIESFNKGELVEYLTSSKMMTFYTRYAISAFLYLVIIYIMVTLLDALEIAIFGWITTRITRTRIRFSAIYSMAAYALTLPIILNILYMMINYFMDFTITYFQVAYVTIAYIYLATAIFILKDDFIKKMQEVEQIKKEQEKVKEEIQEQQKQKRDNKDEQQKEEENNEKNKDDDKGEEPQGSQA